MAMYDSSARIAPRWDTDGMSDADATELRALIDSLAELFDTPQFIAKAVGYDALAVAKRNQDLYSLRHYDRLFRTGVSPRHIVDAVKTGKLFRGGGLPEITVEQVESHAIVFHAIKGVTGGNADRIRKLALTYPGQGDFIVELMAEREMGDPSQIKAVLDQARGTTTPLHDGLL